MAQGAFAWGRTYVDAPEFTPTGGGLLYAAEIREVADGAPELRGYSFDSDAAEVNVGTTAFSGDVNTTGALTPGDNTQLSVSDDPFTIYGAFSGTMPIRTEEEALARAAERLALGEGVGVERAFWKGILAKQAAGNLLRGTTAVKADIGLGIVAEYMGEHFNGVPHFHAGRRLSNKLAGLQLVNLPDEGNASIKGGGALVNGAGYAAKTAINTAADGSGTAVTPTTDQVWLVATGSPLFYRGPVGPSGHAKFSINQVSAYAQRTYVPSIGGPVVAVLIDLTL